MSFVIGVKIYKDIAHEVLDLSHKAYIEHVVKRFNIENCNSDDVSIVKGDKFIDKQCYLSDVKRGSM